MSTPGGSSPWDVPGLRVDVGALLGDVAPDAPASRPATQRAQGAAVGALVKASPGLAENVERCHDAIGAARSTVRDALGAGQAQETPQVEAWLALMDEVLNFGESLTGVLLREAQSQSIRRNQ